MKSFNQNLVLNLIRDNEFSRADISRKIGLTRAAVTNIVDGLIENKLVIERKSDKVNLGRKPLILEINPNAYYSIGLDLSREGYSIGIINLSGKAIDKIFIEMIDSNDWRYILKVIINSIDNMILKNKISKRKILGLGVTSPGPLDYKKGIILNPTNFTVWEGADIVTHLKTHYNFNIQLDNNSKALAKAEMHYGIGKHISNYIRIIVDTGIGAGIVINRKLYRGVTGFDGEIGHISIDLNGIQCACGNVGCLENYASIPAIVNSAKMLNSELVSWSEIINKAEEGNTTCISIIKDEAKYLSCAISDTINILGINNIIISGDISYKSYILKKYMEENFRKIKIREHYTPISIYDSELKCGSNIISAANIVLDTFFETY